MKKLNGRSGSIIIALFIVTLLIFSAFPALADSDINTAEDAEAEVLLKEEVKHEHADTDGTEPGETAVLESSPDDESDSVENPEGEAEGNAAGDSSGDLEPSETAGDEAAKPQPSGAEYADDVVEVKKDDSAEPAPIYGPAEIRTDQEDYLPGETAVISGHGFMPVEEVRLLITDLTGSIVYNAVVITDAEGGFTATHVVRKGPAYLVSATGLISGLEANTSFTDSTAQVTGFGAGTNVTGSTGNPWAGLIIANVDGVAGVLTYCIDILHSIAIGNTLVDGPPTSPEITYILNNYYPLVTRGDQLSPLGKETAAIQSAIWYFSDAFVITGPSAIKARAQSIIADAEANAGDVAVPTKLTLEPQEAVNEVGDVHEVTATLTADAGYELEGVTIEFEVSGANSASGSAATDASGKAVFSYTGSNEGNDVIEAWVTFTIPAGISFVSPEGKPRRQSLVLAHPTQGRVSDNAEKTWVEYGELYGYKWLDENGDGIHQDDEAALEGVTIRLEGEGIAEERITDSNGYFLFADLEAGEYLVMEEVPEGYYATSPAEVEIMLAAGEEKRVDFLNAEKARVSGEKLDSTTQEPVAGVKFVLEGDDFYMELASDENGHFDFGWLMPGEYLLYEVVPEGWVPVSETEHEIVLENGDDEHFVFLNERLSAIYGYKWLDENGDGIHQDDEAALEGVTIRLEGEGIAEERITDSNGYFLFADLEAGEYLVMEEVPEGYYATSPAEVEIMLAAGEEKRADFLNAPLAAVLGTKWLDLNANGQFDEGEKGLAGVTIRLLDEEGEVIAITVTGADGSYAFEGLEAGEYSVEEIVPDGYVATSPVSVSFDLSAGEEMVIDFHNNVQIAAEVVTPVEPAQPEAEQTLPVTGFELSWMLLAIGLIILLGAALTSFGLVRLTR